MHFYCQSAVSLMFLFYTNNVIIVHYKAYIYMYKKNSIDYLKTKMFLIVLFNFCPIKMAFQILSFFRRFLKSG